MAQEEASHSSSWEANAEVVEELSQRRSDFNYYESRVPEYVLPDALKTLDGQTVRTEEDWRGRRQELLTLFRDNVYGHRPASEYDVEFETKEEVADALDGTAHGYSMLAIIRIPGQHKSFSFPFTVFIPKYPQRHSPDNAPVIVHINNRYFVDLHQAIEEEDPFWPARAIVARGYATASFHTSHVDPDRKDGYAKGIRSFFAKGKSAEDLDWRCLSSWGWAASRVLDYFETTDGVDSQKSAVVGHSRGGKTALWAACEDARFSIAYSNNSGCGGAALSRRCYGETVARITASFPHWFCKPFSNYGGAESELPVDQHQVIGLIAPRAVYVASADQDLWADPRGEYSSIVEAAPVFALLNQKSIVNKLMPALNQQRVVGKTGYHVRSGGHGLELRDWKMFLDFADRQFAITR